MRLYCGIDLHSNNSVVVILDEEDKVIYQKKLNNNLAMILQQLSVFADKLQAIAIESTFNGYWLVDGLMEAGYEVKLVNTAGVQTYSGLKFSDDKDDARWLADLLRGTSIYSWIGTLSPKFPIAVLQSARNRTAITNT